MKATKQIDIYLTKKRNVRLIDVVQYDTGIQLVFTVKDFTIPSGATATLYVQKPSGKFVYQEDGITVSGSTVTINLHNQAITEHGKVPYQVSLKSGSDVITTFTGLMMVEKSLKDAGATESVTVIRAFDEAVSDHVAEFQTKSEQIVAACIATIPEDYTVMEAKVNELANAVKGYLSGAVVVADDVSPVEHNPVVKVHGKNLISYPHNNTTKTENGLTFTDNGDGSIHVKGTATAVTYYDLCKFSSRFFKEDSLYLNAMSKPVIRDGYAIKDCSVQQAVGRNTFCHLVITSGQTVDKTFYPQVENGDTATDYEPYINPETVTVRRCGKNIFNVAAKSQTLNGVTFTVNDDGSVTANGTATKATFIGLGSLVLKPDEKYRLSGSPAGSGFDTYMLYIHNNTTGADIYDLGEGKVFTGKEGDLGVTIAVYAGNTVNNLIFRPMVVYGEESGTFEPYNGAVYVPADDGTVSGLTSISPSMTILTDTAGAIVECEYNRDTNKVIDKLINAITALGGTV